MYDTSQRSKGQICFNLHKEELSMIELFCETFGCYKDYVYICKQNIIV
jgi:hypothetical protein